MAEVDVTVEVARVEVTATPAAVQVAAPGNRVDIAATTSAVTVAATPATVTVTTGSLPGPAGEPGVGLREVYLNDEVVPDGVPTWLRVITDESGDVVEIYLGVADA